MDILQIKAERAKAAHALAGVEFLAAVKRAFPVGTLVEVTNSSGHRHTIRVTGHGDSWCDPERVHGINVDTGKDRHFYVGFTEVRIISRPEPLAEAAS